MRVNKWVAGTMARSVYRLPMSLPEAGLGGGYVKFDGGDRAGNRAEGD